jgi:glycosyltransferase involved in cell wall biosynthesis
MNIAIFHNSMWPRYKGAVFSAVHELSRGTATRVSFTQIAEIGQSRPSMGGVDLSFHRYPYELIFAGEYAHTPTLTRLRALVSRAWSTPADVVLLPGYHCLEYWAMLAVLVLRRKTRGVFCDSTAFDRPPSLVKSFAYGARSRDYLMRHGVPAHKIYTGCQAAALAHDYREEAALAARLRAAPGPQEPPRFLFVGRLAPEKGLDTLMDAMVQVCAVHPGATLTLVGGGALREALQRAAAQRHLTEPVRFLGGMDLAGLAEQYARATALVLPSLSEPWGLVVNEALSYGCPVIVSRICGCVPELVEGSDTGLVFEPGDANDLAAQLLKAPGAFADTAAVAHSSLRRMRQYTPARVAENILKGCDTMLARTARRP